MAAAPMIKIAVLNGYFQKFKLSIQHIVITTAVSLITLLATFFAAFITQQAINRKLAGFFEQQADQITSRYQLHLSSYISVLGGFRGLWNTRGDSLDHQSFITYVNALSQDSTFESGVSSFFYIVPVPNTERISFENRIKKEHNLPLPYQAFDIHPNSVAKTLYPVVYVEPILSREKSLALDFSTFPERLIAIEQARDQGVLTSTTTTIFVSNNKPGFFFFLPLYKQGLPINTITERQDAFQGLLGVSFRSESVFNKIFGQSNNSYPQLDFQIFLGEVSSGNLLYDYDPSFTAKNPRFKTVRVVYLHGQTWTILVQSKPAFSLTNSENNLPLVVILTGMIFTIVIINLSLAQLFALQKKSSRHDKSN